MLCCLCIKEIDINYDSCIDGKQLYSTSGEHTEVYNISYKYFEQQLRLIEKCAAAAALLAKMICNHCWQRIYTFNDFQNNVLAAHEDLVQRLKEQDVKQPVDEEAEEQPIKLEIKNELTEPELPVDGINALFDIKPIKLETQPDVLQYSDADNNDISFSSDDSDNKPLIERIRNKTNSPKKIKHKQRTTAKNEKEEEEEQANTEAARRKREQDEFILNHWPNQMQCGQCGEPCPNFAAVRTHFRVKHDTSRAYVNCCSRKHFHRFHLVDHIQVHINAEYFKCKECGKCHGNRRSLQTHIKNTHLNQEPLERRFECEICHKRFAKAGILKGHMDIHAEGSKDHVCKFCGKGFVLKHRLTIHERNVHSNAGGGVCDQCGKEFRGRYGLKHHLLEHAGISKPKWPCDQCTAELNSKFSLQRHKRVAHSDNNTVYRCSECGKIALSEDALLSHKKYMHQSERKFKCNICGKAFKVAVVLREHLTTHTGEDLYKCPHCPRTFKVCANMHHHRKRKHPKEWAETRQHRTLAIHTDLSTATNEVVL